MPKKKAKKKQKAEAPKPAREGVVFMIAPIPEISSVTLGSGDVIEVVDGLAQVPVDLESAMPPGWKRAPVE